MNKPDAQKAIDGSMRALRIDFESAFVKVLVPLLNTTCLKQNPDESYKLPLTTKLFQLYLDGFLFALDTSDDASKIVANLEAGTREIKKCKTGKVFNCKYSSGCFELDGCHSGCADYEQIP